MFGRMKAKWAEVVMDFCLVMVMMMEKKVVLDLGVEGVPQSHPSPNHLEPQ